MERYSIEAKYDKTDPKSIEEYAQLLIGHSFNEVSKWDYPVSIKEDYNAKENYGKKARKGGLGNLIEEKFFGYKANSDREADFKEAGVELKVTPYEKKKNGKLSAGERLVLTMLSYEEAVEPDFFDSHLWAKCQLILLIYYLRDRSLGSNLNYRIDYAKLFSPPEEDLRIIVDDYKKIIGKVASGKAHELSESDTMYLGACTKGANAERSTVPQKYYAPEVKARKRAFCFKTSYMTYVLNNYIVSDIDTCEHIVKDPNELNRKTFEEYVTSRINSFAGKTDIELCELFDREYNNNKAQWIDLAYRMLGISTGKAEEFEKAHIVVKAIRIEESGKIKENMSFPPFRFKELADEEWEESKLYTYFNETKFLFVVYRRSGDCYKLKGAQMWNMPYNDLNETVHDGWRSVKDVILDGVVLKRENGVISNNFPKKKANPIVHIRPHAAKAFYVFEDGSTYGNGKLTDSDELPDGRRMTKQSFWLNNDYVISILDERIKE